MALTFDLAGVRNWRHPSILDMVTAVIVATIDTGPSNPIAITVVSMDIGGWGGGGGGDVSTSSCCSQNNLEPGTGAFVEN